MISTVLILAMSASGLGHHGGYASAQCPTKCLPAPQAPTKCPPVPTKCPPVPTKCPPAPPKCLPAPQCPSKVAPAPQAYGAPHAPIKTSPQW